MSVYERQFGEEQPHWPAGPFKVRLPFIHYRWEITETLQGLVMFVVGLAMIPLLEQYLGMPYEAALGFTIVAAFAYTLPALLGVPLVPGWITPAIPVVLLFLNSFEPGPDAIKALFALQIEVSLIFLILGVTRLGTKLVEVIPRSLKGGIIIGAGIAALMGELAPGGRVESTPVSLLAGAFITVYILFSASFKNATRNSSLANAVASYGMVPGVVAAMAIGWSIGEYDLPTIEWGITSPDLALMWQYLPFTVGFPDASIYLLAIPTALVAYVIAFGDIIVGFTLVERIDHLRKDEAIDDDVNRVHVVTAIRNAIHSFFAPWPGLAGPLWTAVHVTITERYALGRKAMDSIYSGGGSFWLTGLVAIFILPLVSLFRPVLPIALSLTLILTAYVCIRVGIEQLKTTEERGIAGIVAVTLATPDPNSVVYAVLAGLLLHFTVERQTLFGFGTTQPATEPADAFAEKRDEPIE